MSQKQNPAILFEDPHLLVLSKPAGLLSQGEIKGEPNLVDWLRTYLKRNYVGLIHRLDRNTSGVMLVAKRTKAARRLTEALQEGKIARTYLAIVRGNLQKEIKWTHYLSKNVQTNKVSVVKKNNPSGKIAVLSVRPVSFGLYQHSPVTWVEFNLETGRSHQIRAQSAYEGYPLLGDKKYLGDKKNLSEFPRTALHSHRIIFPHPMSGEVLKFTDQVPEDMRAVIRSSHSPN